MSKTIASMNKTELANLVRTQAAELAALRTQLSELSVRAEAKVLSTPTDERVHEYDTFAEATARCKALVAWDTDRRYMFVQRGNKVVCKIRAAH